MTDPGTTRVNPWNTALISVGVLAFILGLIITTSPAPFLGVGIATLGAVSIVGWLLYQAFSWRP